MRPYVKVCSSTDDTRNTGYKKPDCLETLLELPVLSMGYKFETVAAFEDKSIWKAQIATKQLVPLFDVYEVADGSTDDTFYETGNFKRRTEKGKDVLNFECYLSYCAYAALKSYEQSGYTEMFEFNQGGDYSGVFDTDGIKVKGRKIQSITVERRRGTKDKVPYVTGEIVFADKDDVLKTVLTKGDLSKDDLDGIYDVTLNIVSASATEIKFTASSGCAGGELISVLEDGDVTLLDDNGDGYTNSFVAADAEGVYTLTGTGFATDFTIEVEGVVVKEDIMLEGIEPTSITVS